MSMDSSETGYLEWKKKKWAEGNKNIKNMRTTYHTAAGKMKIEEIQSCF